VAIVENLISLTERTPLPDTVTRAGVHYLVDRTRRALARSPANATRDFARSMSQFPVALATAEANQQHYEIPAAFFAQVLGHRYKYSCCYFDDPAASLDAAEDRALALTVEHADIRNGQSILELGCGWGSLSLWMAEKFPGATITSVSNSASQRQHILGEAARRGLTNLDVITADMNDFAPAGPARFDRIVSVEMFEHISNWRELLTRAASWLAPDGRVFIHVFSHQTAPYRFDHTDKTDWIAQHFFTGGIMPSHGLMHEFADIFTVEADWRWSGSHYQLTAERWLENYDRNSAQIDTILSDVYGADAALWKRRWRLFFLATRGLFGHAGGDVWGISHYRLRHAR
jgi:cyclopropane-fatty-acyl-phospholipid synthase